MSLSNATVRIEDLAQSSNAQPQIDVVPKPHLKPVQKSVKADRINPLYLALTSVLGILFILGAQFWLNLSLSQGAYEISELTVQERELSRVDRALHLDVSRLSSPQNLAIEAGELGMVQNSRPAYLVLADSKIAGSIEQSTSKPRTNLVNNSALNDLKAKQNIVVDKPAAEKPAAEKPVAATADSKEAAKAQPKAEPKEDPKGDVKQDVKADPAPAVKTPTVSENSSSSPVPWEGKLVAPNTH